MSASDIELLRGALAVFARGEIETATEVLHPDVRWYNAGEPDAEGACHNREQARALGHSLGQTEPYRAVSGLSNPALDGSGYSRFAGILSRE